MTENQKYIELTQENPILWRYMSLDKFIHLISDQSLFFTGLGHFEHSDPAEGSLPKKILEKIHMEDSKRISEAINKKLKIDISTSPSTVKKIDILTKELLKTRLKSWAISCWHMNDCESEAMWRLYSDSSKGVAIKTRFNNVFHSLTDHEKPLKLLCDKVLYVDFEKHEPSSHEFEQTVPLPIYKARSFIHENEFRLYIQNDIEMPQTSLVDLNTLGKQIEENTKDAKKECKIIKCNANNLIQEVIISPYTSEPFDSAVKAVSEKFGLKAPIRKSKLLDGYYFFKGDE